MSKTPRMDAWIASGSNPENIARKLEVECNGLRLALENAADTFQGYERGLRVIGRDTLADGCKIAEESIRSALSVKVRHVNAEFSRTLESEFTALRERLERAQAALRSIVDYFDPDNKMLYNEWLEKHAAALADAERGRK